jgi:hypothetical protein
MVMVEEGSKKRMFDELFNAKYEELFCDKNLK